MRSAIARLRVRGCGSRGDELAEPPAPPNEQVQTRFLRRARASLRSRATSWDLTLRHLHWRQPAYEVALVNPVESTRGLRSQSQERGVSFFGAGADLRVPISWGRLTLLPGLRASLAVAQGFGPPPVSAGPYQPSPGCGRVGGRGWLRAWRAGWGATRCLGRGRELPPGVRVSGVDLSGPSLAAVSRLGAAPWAPPADRGS